MALKIIGESGYEADVNTDKALYVESRPPAAAGGGAYMISLNTGSITATLGANSNLFSFQWTHPTKLCLIHHIDVAGFVVSAITTGVQFDLAVYFARSFTAPDTGGTAYNIFSPDNQKLRRNFSASLVGDLRSASTAGATTGTRTLDTNPLARVTGWTGTAVGTLFFKNRGTVELLDRTYYGYYPIVLAKNEGIVIQNPKAGPVDGTFALAALIEWNETSAY